MGKTNTIDFSSNSTIREITERLESPKVKKSLKISKKIRQELVGYLEVRPLLPKTANRADKDNVRTLQKSLVSLEARVDRALAVEDETRKVLRFVYRLEHEIRLALFEDGYLTKSASRPASEQAVTLAVPELMVIKQRWKDLEVLCRTIHKRVGEAKDTVKLMVKLDDNYHWSNRD